jgi:hypothetical protein
MMMMMMMMMADRAVKSPSSSGRCSNTSDFYSGGTCLESRPDYRLTWLKVVFLMSYSRRMPEDMINGDVQIKVKHRRFHKILELDIIKEMGALFVKVYFILTCRCSYLGALKCASPIECFIFHSSVTLYTLLSMYGHPNGCIVTVQGPTQPPIQWVPWILSSGVKRPVHESDHSSPSSAEVKNAWSYTSTPTFIFVAWCLVKHRVCIHGVVPS